MGKISIPLCLIAAKLAAFIMATAGSKSFMIWNINNVRKQFFKNSITDSPHRFRVGLLVMFAFILIDDGSPIFIT